jgi:Zn-dependent protease
MQTLPFLIAALIPALTFHEWGHAFAASRFGDDTARHQGRLTLNPLSHLDPLGTLVLLMAGFGWAKPVPVNPSNFRHPWAEFWVAAAGPIMNMILGLTAAILIHLQAYSWFGPEAVMPLMKFLQIFFVLNFALAIFNLIPIGPLDGSHIAEKLLPLRQSLAFRDWNMRMGSYVLFGLIIFEAIFKVGIIRPIIFGGVNLVGMVLGIG